MDLWILHVARPCEYEMDFAGVYERVSTEQLRAIGNADTVWKFHKNYIFGYNVKWADKTAPQFRFTREKEGTFLVPAHMA